jgi:hypothetical protein
MVKMVAVDGERTVPSIVNSGAGAARLHVARNGKELRQNQQKED